MPQIDICLSPDLLKRYRLEGKVAVIIDVLRATSTIVAGLAAGVDHFIAFAELEACAHYKTFGYLTAAERDGLKADGFDLGNSPLALLNREWSGEKIAITTTNGTLALTESKAADEILVAGFINLTATANYLLQQERDVVLVCAGWKGQPSAEDTLFAGALAKCLIQSGFTADSDAAHLSLSYAEASHDEYASFLQNCSHIQRLGSLGIADDVAFCLKPDQFNLVARLQDGKLIKV